MQYAVSTSDDYLPNKVVIRDYTSTPPGRVLCVIVRENQHEAEQVGQLICDALNTKQ